MTATEQLIRAAVEGGFSYRNHKEIHVFEGSRLRVSPSILVEYHDGYRERVPVSEFLMSPDFWKCAGKALGWPSSVCDRCGDANRRGWLLSNPATCAECGKGNPTKGCRYRQGCLLDALAAGKTAEDYLANLMEK